MTFDIYGDRAVEAMALIREFARVEYWNYFKGDPERALEAFCVMQDAAEAKSAARIAELEAQVSALKAAGGMPSGYVLVPLEPTEEMIQVACINQAPAGEYSDYEAWWNDHSSGVSEKIRGYVASDYRAMLSAAPIAAVAEQTKQQEPK